MSEVEFGEIREPMTVGELLETLEGVDRGAVVVVCPTDVSHVACYYPVRVIPPEDNHPTPYDGEGPPIVTLVTVKP